MQRLLQLIVLFLFASVAEAQYPPLPPVFQSGQVTPGHLTGWCANGVVCDTGIPTPLPTNTGPCINVTTYGARADTFTDNTGAVNAALLTLPSQGGCIYFPAGPGQYLMASTVTYNIAAGATFDLDIRGDGPDSSTLYWPSSNGLVVNFNDTNGFYGSQSVHIHGLSFVTGSLGTGNAITINEAGTHNGAYAPINVFRDLAFRSNDHYLGNNYWTNAIVLSGGVSNTTVDSIIVQGGGVVVGNGISISGTPGNIAVVLNVNNSTFNQLTTGILYGSYVQGVAVNTCNFSGVTFGISVPSPGIDVDQLSVVNSQFGLFAPGQNGIQTNVTIPFVQISNNVFGQSASTGGINLVSVGAFAITGNTFIATSLSGTIGINVVSNVAGGAISGNMFNTLNTAVALQAGSQNINVGFANTFVGNTNAIGNAGTNNLVSGGNLVH